MKKIFLGVIALGFLASCSLTRPYAVTNNTLGSKKGVSKTTVVFGYSAGPQLATGIVLNKDFGVVEAAKNGGITTIGCVDVKTTNYVLFQKVEIIVTGE